MKNFSKILLNSILVFGLSRAGVGLAQQKSVRAVVTAKSANWQVAIISAAKYTRARINPNIPNQYLEPPVYKNDCYNIALELSFVYLGPPGDIVAPSIFAINEKGAKFQAMGNISTSSTGGGFEWLITLARDTPDKRALKGGEKFGDDSPITFYIGDIPSSSTDIKIGFADVPPIPIKLTQLR
jgi:hypothetical protein